MSGKRVKRERKAAEKKMQFIRDCIERYESVSDLCVNDSQGHTTVPSFSNISDSVRASVGFNVWYVSDVHLEHRLSNKPNDMSVEMYIRQLVERMCSDWFLKSLKELSLTFVIFCGDIAADFELSKLFYSYFMDYVFGYFDRLLSETNLDEVDRQILSGMRSRFRVFAVLGNHELWPFDTVDACVSVYSKFFDDVGIVFLNNSSYFVEFLDFPISIIGGTGFARYNSEFNADNGIYRNSMDRPAEIEATRDWERYYTDCLYEARHRTDLYISYCRKSDGKSYCFPRRPVLIVVTHNPVSDWKCDGKPDVGCVYFNGHTHDNSVLNDDDLDVHVFSDNQVGYKSNRFELRLANLYYYVNPFAWLSDGCHEISDVYEYQLFCMYCHEYVKGISPIKNQIEKHGAKFYVVKHDGYYGFFLVGAKLSYICQGGKTVKLSGHWDIDMITAAFPIVVNNYIAALKPYRDVQEKLSAFVKSFGGDGRIHGSIIDISFTCHIMLNPVDGQLTYYYSSMFGEVETFDSLYGLLHTYRPELACIYERLLKSADVNDTGGLMKLDAGCGSDVSQVYQLDIKNSPYAVSARLNQHQRLFTCKVLRAWPDELIRDLPALAGE